MIYELIGPNKKYLIHKEIGLNIKLIDNMFLVFEIITKYLNNSKFKYSIIQDTTYLNLEYFKNLLLFCLINKKY